MLLLSGMMENELKHTKTSCVVKMTKKNQLWQLSCRAGQVAGAAAFNETDEEITEEGTDAGNEIEE